MIDIEKELAYYQAMNSSRAAALEATENGELVEILKGIEEKFDKIGTFQYKTYHVVEDIIEQLEEAAQSEVQHIEQARTAKYAGNPYNCC